MQTPENSHDNGKFQPFEDVYVYLPFYGDFPASHVTFHGGVLAKIDAVDKS